MKESKNPTNNVRCQICNVLPKKIVDCPTIMGPWAFLCEPCAEEHGKNLHIATIHKNKEI